MHWAWDSKKARSNLKKHGVSFEEAKSVLDHPDTLVVYDSENSTVTEDRFKSLGISIKSNVLVVIHCERHGREFRIISARKAERHEVMEWHGRR